MIRGHQNGVSVKSLPSVAKYMLARIGAVTTIILALLTIITLWGVVGTGDAITTVILEAFRSQLKRHAGAAASELASYVRTEMSGIERDVVRSAAVHLEQAMGNNDSLARWAGADDAQFPILPLQDDTRYDDSVLVRDARSGQMVREGRRSTWAFHPNHSVTPAASFVRRQSSTVDLLIPSMLAVRPSVAQLYAAFTAGGLLRIAPGVNATRILTVIDATQRSWFLRAVASLATAQTDPYIDAGGLGWMVTLSTPVRSFAFSASVGPAIGVVGADITISQLQRRVQEVSVFNRNAGHLITAAGRVVASPFFDGQRSAAAAYASGSPEALAAEAPLAWDVLPFVDRQLWARLLRPEGGSEAMRHTAGGKVYLIARAFVRAGASAEGERGALRFVVLVVVEEEEALQPFSLLNLQILSSVGAVVAYALICILLVFFVTGLVVVRYAWHVTAPLKMLVSVSDAITAATAAAATGTQMRHSAASDAARLRRVISQLPDGGGRGSNEITEFVASFKGMLRGTNQHAARVAEAQDHVEYNPYYVGPPGTEGEGVALPWQRAMREAGIEFGEPGVEIDAVEAEPLFRHGSFVDATAAPRSQTRAGPSPLLPDETGGDDAPESGRPGSDGGSGTR